MLHVVWSANGFRNGARDQDLGPGYHQVHPMAGFANDIFCI